MGKLIRLSESAEALARQKPAPPAKPENELSRGWQRDLAKIAVVVVVAIGLVLYWALSR